jgi:very-short-patch-repair endonuclease
MKLDKANDVFKNRARELRKQGIMSEVLLWNQLKNKKLLNLDFDRQKVINNKYIVDFYCSRYNLVIEIDGYSHNDKGEYDLKRDNYLTNIGLKIIHIYEIDMKTNMVGVISYITNFIKTYSTSAEKSNI